MVLICFSVRVILSAATKQLITGDSLQTFFDRALFVSLMVKGKDTLPLHRLHFKTCLYTSILICFLHVTSRTSGVSGTDECLAQQKASCVKCFS